ncbi:MAG: glycosyltransferase family 2 protein [Flavobacterium sp.]|jgi:hypothetical protein
MKIAGFTFIKNAVQNDYPIVEAMMSILPICDEFIVAVGKSDDDTLELIKSINSDKIKIVETVWDGDPSVWGENFRRETDKAISRISKDIDWCFYIQGDECVHEKYLETIKKEMEICLNNSKIEGLLFKYLHFYGSYDYVAVSRRWYRREIRIIKNIKGLHSYKDAQGFRIDNRKIKVKLIDAFIYHYGWVKPPAGFNNKRAKKDTMTIANENDFDYGNADRLIYFNDTHPKVINEKLNNINWKFSFDLSKMNANLTLRRRFLQWIEITFGKRIFEYKNYKIVAKHD